MALKTLKPRVSTLQTATAKSLSATVRMRGSALQRDRKRLFEMNPLCAECERNGFTREATERDHIVPLCEGGADADSNVQGLCAACHATKSAREAAQRSGG